MPLQILKPTPKKDQLTTIAQALGIAKDIYGIVGQSRQLDALAAKTEAEEAERERLESGELRPLEAAELTKGGRQLVPTPFGPQEKGAIGGFTVGGEAMTLLPGAGDDKSLSRKLKQKQLEELEKKPEREDLKELVAKREKIDNYYRPFDRLYSSIGALEQKFKAGKFNPQDGIQLVRLIVPLSEINPGVVRGEEYETVTEGQSAINRAQLAVNKLTKGEVLSNKIIKDMFNTAASLRPVVGNLLQKDLGNIYKQSEEYGIQDKANIILGEKNYSILKDPSKFGIYGKQGLVKRYSPGFREGGIPGGAKPKKGLTKVVKENKYSKLSDEELDRKIAEAEETERQRKAKKR